MENSNAVILKTPGQIEGIRRSCQIAASMLRDISQYVLPGFKTRELNEIIHLKMERANAVPATLGYKGFPASCCISVNSGICHGVPNDTILEEGDVVKIDVTTIFDGYYGDTCYTWVVPGGNHPESLRIVAAARACLRAGLMAVQPWKRLGTVSRAVKIAADKRRCSVVHQFCGHGVGIRFHEPPNVPYHLMDESYGPEMTPGMIFTIEPMINLGVAEAIIDAADGWSSYTADDKLSAQFEHTVLVTDVGCEVLTDWGDERTMQANWRQPCF